MLSLFLPLVFPNVGNSIYYGIFPLCLFSELFYTQPFLYVLSMCALNFVFGGLIACLCYVVSLFVRNRVVVTLVPFALLLALRFGQQVLLAYYPSLLHREFNPLFFLRGGLAMTTLTVVLAEILVLAAFSLGLILALPFATLSYPLQDVQSFGQQVLYRSKSRPAWWLGTVHPASFQGSYAPHT